MKFRENRKFKKKEITMSIYHSSSRYTLFLYESVNPVNQSGFPYVRQGFGHRSSLHTFFKAIFGSKG